MDAQHTPTPWTVIPGETMIGATNNGRHWIVADTLSDGLRDAETCEIDAANAAFIVRACNSHAALVAAATEAENWLSEYESGPDSGLSGLLNQLRAALAAAGEGA